MSKFKLGDASFGCLQDKQIWILEGVVMNLQYMGKETKLSFTEKMLRQLAIKKVQKVIKSIEKTKK